MTHSAPALPAPATPGRRLLSAALGALLLLGFAARLALPHTPATFVANDGTKTGTGGG